MVQELCGPVTFVYGPGTFVSDPKSLFDCQHPSKDIFVFIVGLHMVCTTKVHHKSSQVN